ncbi:MAG: OsmC family protein [Acinetobacter sp.]
MSRVGHSQVIALEEQWKGQVITGKHQFLTDEPEHMEGQDQGPAPYDLLSSALAACTMITLRMYAQHKNIELGNFHVEVDFIMSKDQPEHIERRLYFKNTLDDDIKNKLLAICQKTPVTKTLLRSVSIQTTIAE